MLMFQQNVFNIFPFLELFKHRRHQDGGTSKVKVLPRQKIFKFTVSKFHTFHGTIHHIKSIRMITYEDISKQLIKIHYWNFSSFLLILTSKFTFRFLGLHALTCFFSSNKYLCFLWDSGQEFLMATPVLSLCFFSLCL